MLLYKKDKSQISRRIKCKDLISLKFVCKFVIILDVLAFKKCLVWLETHLECTNSLLENSF